MGLIELLVIVILIFWVLSLVPMGGPSFASGNSFVHLLLVLVVIVVLLRVLGVV